MVIGPNGHLYPPYPSRRPPTRSALHTQRAASTAIAALPNAPPRCCALHLPRDSVPRAAAAAALPSAPLAALPTRRGTASRVRIEGSAASPRPDSSVQRTPVRKSGRAAASVAVPPDAGCHQQLSWEKAPRLLVASLRRPFPCTGPCLPASSSKRRKRWKARSHTFSWILTFR